MRNGKHTDDHPHNMHLSDCRRAEQENGRVEEKL